MDTLSLELQSREVVNQLLVFAGIVLFSLIVSLFLALGEYMMAAVLLGGVCFTVLFFAHPKIAVILILVTRFNLHVIRVESLFGLGVDGILNLVTIILGGFYWAMNYQRLRWPKELRLMLVFLAFIATSVIWSVWRGATMRMGLRVVGYFVVSMIVAGEYRTRKDLQMMINVLCVAAIPNMFYALYGYLRNPAVFLGTPQKLAGLSYATPWGVGDYAMALGSLLLWYLVVSPRALTFGNVLRWGLLAVLGLVLVLSKTRAAMIAFLLTNVPLLFAARFVPLHRKAVAAVTILLVVALTLPAIGHRFRDLKEQKTAAPWNEFGPDNSFEWRLYLWGTMMRFVQPHLLLGAGYGSIMWYNAFINLEVTWPVSGHSEYVQNVVELGIPGSILSVCTLIMMVRYCWRRFRRWTDLFGRVLAIVPMAITLQWLMISFVDDFLQAFAPTTMLFVTLGMLRAYETYVLPEVEAKQDKPAAAPPPRRAAWKPAAARAASGWRARFGVARA